MRRVQEVYIYVAENGPPRNEEVIVAGFVPGAGWASFTFAKRSNADVVLPEVRRIATKTGNRIRLLRFQVSTELLVVEP